MRKRQRRKRARHPPSTCPSHKRQYDNELTAKLKLASIVLLTGPIHQERRAYPCQLCGQWHLTKQERRERKEQQ
jgi:hypothetical protein